MLDFVIFLSNFDKNVAPSAKLQPILPNLAALVLHAGSISDPLGVLGRIWGVLGRPWDVQGGNVGSRWLHLGLHLPPFGSFWVEVWVHSGPLGLPFCLLWGLLGAWPVFSTKFIRLSK